MALGHGKYPANATASSANGAAIATAKSHARGRPSIDLPRSIAPHVAAAASAIHPAPTSATYPGGRSYILTPSSASTSTAGVKPTANAIVLRRVTSDFDGAGSRLAAART